MAEHLVFIAVAEVVVESQFLTGGYVAPGEQINPAVLLSGLAVRLARMIHQRSHADTINYGLAVRQQEQIGGGELMVDAVGFLAPQATARIFQQPCPFLDRTGGKAPATLDGGRADLNTKRGFEGFHVRMRLYRVMIM